MGVSYSYIHAAALCAQLPRESRLARVSAPECEWSEAEYILHKIEYSLRVIAWQNTKDARKGRRCPKPLPTPAEEVRLRQKLERTNMADIAKKLKTKEVSHGGN